MSANELAGTSEVPALKDSDPADGVAQLEATIESKLEPLFRPDKREQGRAVVRMVIQEVQERYSGPLPHPRHLEAYERTLPGAAERVFNMTEAEQRHRHAWEMRQLEGTISAGTLGQKTGTFIAAGLIVGAVICAFLGANVIGAALVGASAISMVPALIKGRSLLGSSSSSTTEQDEPKVTPVPRKNTRQSNPRRRSSSK